MTFLPGGPTERPPGRYMGKEDARKPAKEGVDPFVFPVGSTTAARREEFSPKGSPGRALGPDLTGVL